MKTYVFILFLLVVIHHDIEMVFGTKLEINISFNMICIYLRNLLMISVYNYFSTIRNSFEYFRNQK